MPATPTNIAVLVFECALLLAGLVLIGRITLTATGRARWRQPPALRPWRISLVDFGLFLFLVVIGALAAQVAASLILGSLKLSTDTQVIIANAAFQLGLLVSVAMLPLGFKDDSAEPNGPVRTLLEGGVTFLIALPIVSAVNLLWIVALDYCGLPTQGQELLKLFERTESPALLGLLIALATIVAPIAEELVFRGTLFRFLRTRCPRLLALLGPGVVFAALHVSWTTLDGLASFAPLVALAVVLALAYERTGRITTAIVAHAFFNLHSVLLLFSGVTS